MTNESDKHGTAPAEATRKEKGAHEAHETSNAPYGKEEHMNEELAKQSDSERKPS